MTSTKPSNKRSSLHKSLIQSIDSSCTTETLHHHSTLKVLSNQQEMISKSMNELIKEIDSFNRISSEWNGMIKLLVDGVKVL